MILLSEFLSISTDYFSGCGEQSATKLVLLENGHTLPLTYYSSYRPINEALKDFGVIADVDQDEFDTINLGRYRSNEDFSFNQRIVYTDEELDNAQNSSSDNWFVCKCGSNLFKLHENGSFCAKCGAEFYTADI